MKELKIEETGTGTYEITVPEGCKAILVSVDGSKPIAIQLEGTPESEYRPSDEDVKPSGFIEPPLNTPDSNGDAFAPGCFGESPAAKMINDWKDGLHEGDEMEIANQVRGYLTESLEIKVQTDMFSGQGINCPAPTFDHSIGFKFNKEDFYGDEPAKTSCLTLGSIKPSDTFGSIPGSILHIGKKETMSKAKEWMKVNGLPDKDTVTLSVKNANRMIEECSEKKKCFDDRVVCLNGCIYVPKQDIETVIVSHDHEGLRIDVEYTNNQNLMYTNPCTVHSKVMADAVHKELKRQGINNIITPSAKAPISNFKITFIK